jgi:hypothetical protein
MPNWSVISRCSLWLLIRMAVSLKENNWFFSTDQTPCPYPTRSLPAQLNKSIFCVTLQQIQSKLCMYVKIWRQHFCSDKRPELLKMSDVLFPNIFWAIHVTSSLTFFPNIFWAIHVTSCLTFFTIFFEPFMSLHVLLFPLWNERTCPIGVCIRPTYLSTKASSRFARFFLVQYTNTGKNTYTKTQNIPSGHKIYPMSIKNTKGPYNIPTSSIAIPSKI